MFFWRGLGIAVPFIGVLCLIGFPMLLGKVVEVEAGVFGWPGAISLIIAGIICWFLGQMLNDPRILIDPTTQEEVEVGGGHHTFFFFPVQYWAVVYLIIGVTVLVT